MSEVDRRVLSTKQYLFIRYSYAILIDLVVLCLFNQFWENVFIENFLIALLVAILLQALLQATLYVEHKVASFFKKKEGTGPKVMRALSTWLIIFSSKFVILAAIDFTFGDRVHFYGAVHGIVAFFAVVIAIILAEQLIIKLHRSLA